MSCRWMKHEVVLLFVTVLVAVATFAMAASSRPALRSSRSKATASPPVGSCSLKSLCCQGKNISCIGTVAPRNGIYAIDNSVRGTVRTKGGRVKPEVQNVVKDSSTGSGGAAPTASTPTSTSTCFCDSACVDLGDCCFDYRETCPPVDCLLETEWGPWSDCDARCGSGIKQRVRRVLTPAQNGGKPCMGNTVEKSVCIGTSCKYARAPDGIEELRETAKIIPAEFGPWRRNKIYNPYEDIRRNLFEHYHNQTVFDRPSYCMEFEITEARPSCTRASSAGTDGTSDGGVEADRSASWTERLIVGKGSTVCVECQALAMRQKLGYRCRGHGVMSKETRWAAVPTTPGTGRCHGKWKLKSRQENCQCASDSRQSFILV